MPSRGRLVWAENAGAIESEMERGAAARPMLVYADPPYFTQVDHGVLGSGRAYGDRWHSPGEYTQFLLDRFAALHRWLDDRGCLFVQCDWRASAWVRLLLDEVFGRACFRNEVVWRRSPNVGRQAAAKQLGRTLDSIFVYTKQPDGVMRGAAPRVLERVPCSRDGRPLNARQEGTAGGFFNTAPRGDYSDESIENLRKQGRIYESSGGVVYVKYPLVQDAAGKWCREVPIDTLWDDEDVRPLRHSSKRELAIRYVTQKPESLLTRIVQWGSREGDLVADPFCGSGTTLAVAEMLGRSWIGIDASPLAISTTRQRLIRLSSPASFEEVWEHGIERMGASTAGPVRTTRSKARVTRGKRASSVEGPVGLAAMTLRVESGSRQVVEVGERLDPATGQDEDWHIGSDGVPCPSPKLA